MEITERRSMDGGESMALQMREYTLYIHWGWGSIMYGLGGFRLEE